MLLKNGRANQEAVQAKTAAAAGGVGGRGGRGGKQPSEWAREEGGGRKTAVSVCERMCVCARARSLPSV